MKLSGGLVCLLTAGLAGAGAPAKTTQFDVPGDGARARGITPPADGKSREREGAREAAPGDTTRPDPCPACGMG